MAKKMSNKARIQQKAVEAAAKREEKIKATAKKKTTTKKKPARKKAATPEVRQKVVWKVFDANYKEVECFSYPEKKKAYATAEKLEAKSNKTHFVNAVTVPMDEEE